MKSKKLISIIMASTMLLMAVGCSNGSDKTGAKSNVSVASSKESKEEVGQLILKGSSTLAPVVNELTKSFTETNKVWSSIDDMYGDEDIDIVISGGGSGAGVKSMIDGSASFGMASRPVSDDEKGKIDGYNEYMLGTDALTISINPKNELLKYTDDISTEDLRRIFSGEYKFWDDFNSELPHEAIVLVTRDIGGGAHKVFQKKVMGDSEVSVDVIQAPSMGALVTKIIENKNAIGYASFGVVNQNEGKLAPLKIDGVAPTAENINSGDYKISRPLLVLTRGEVSPAQKALLDWLQSDDAMEVVHELGFVPAK